ncbi:MAG: hypothetical protein Q9159_006450, partial [Coniocarpon cinnabarinum]
EYLFELGHNWVGCANCMSANVSGEAGASIELTSLWAEMAEASELFCGFPTAGNLRGFIGAWNAVAAAWSPLAYNNFYIFETSTCQSWEQPYLSYFTTMPGNIFGPGTQPAKPIPWAPVGASTITPLEATSTSTSTPGSNLASGSQPMTHLSSSQVLASTSTSSETTSQANSTQVFVGAANADVRNGGIAMVLGTVAMVAVAMIML